MSYHPPVYSFSAEELARLKCLDCGVNVIEVGDYCMLHPALWTDQLHLGWDDNLCIKCIELRIGRKLRPLLSGDFIGFPNVKGYPMSDILRDRIYGDNVVLKTGELVGRNSKHGKAELRKKISATLIVR